MTPEEIASSARSVLARYPGIRVALLFGSRARGMARDESDIDIAIDGRNVDTLEVAVEIGKLVRSEVDITSLDDPPFMLLESIIRDGKIIYERAPGDGAAWRSRTLATLETDRPTFARMGKAWLLHVAKHGVISG